MNYIIAYDLGTGGMKASLYNQEGVSLGSSSVECKTYYPKENFREQRPEDWWEMLKESTKMLMAQVDVDPVDIIGAGISGHSLGVVPIGKQGQLLKEFVPIWSDARAEKEQIAVFQVIDENEWYLKTGNGFPAQLYSAFKILWYKNNERQLYEDTQTFIGTKDYLNYKLTGRLATDHSYASGSGVYDLKKCTYDTDYIQKMGLKESDFPEILESSDQVGVILEDVALSLGLSPKMIISAGGVDNACMAAGAGCVEEGMGYTSLGTSAWIAVCSSDTKVDVITKPYTFAHLIKGKYVPAESIFSAGNTFRWVRDTLCQDLVAMQEAGGENAYNAMTRLASASPIGSNGIFMAPHMAGGNALDQSVNIRGAYVGIDLMHHREDILRATLEGICMNLRLCLDELEKSGKLSDTMLIVGGGAKSAFWRSLFADIYNKNIVESAVGEQAGSLGAMATAAIATGLWEDYRPLIDMNAPISEAKKQEGNCVAYEALLIKFRKICNFLSDIAELK